jgi:large subunit ribosomal protein L32
MAEPKKRMTSTRSGARRSHDALLRKSLVSCSNCKQSVPPHTVCQNCGFYRGKKVLTLKSEKVEQQKIKEELKDE